METGKSNFYPHQGPPYRRGTRLPLDGIFVQIGLAANSAPFRNKLETTPTGEIKIDAFCRTTLPGYMRQGMYRMFPTSR